MVNQASWLIAQSQLFLGTRFKPAREPATVLYIDHGLLLLFKKFRKERRNKEEEYRAGVSLYACRRLYNLTTLAQLDEAFDWQAAATYRDLLGVPHPQYDLDAVPHAERILMQEREAVMLCIISQLCHCTLPQVRWCACSIPPEVHPCMLVQATHIGTHTQPVWWNACEYHLGCNWLPHLPAIHAGT